MSTEALLPRRRTTISPTRRSLVSPVRSADVDDEGVKVSLLSRSPAKSDVEAEKLAAQEASGGLFGFLSARDKNLISFFTFVAVVVRLAFLAMPPAVVFDEVHFGGFANKYLNGEFHLDVHPPLAKLLVTLSGWLSGFQGNFSFWDIGVDYRQYGVPYVGMRAFTALFGVSVVPLTYVALSAFGTSQIGSILGTVLVLFENALTTQSRLILLDAYLVFFTAFSLTAWAVFQRIDRQPGAHFTARWWQAMFATGFGLGCAVSSKWVGLFTIGSVGVQVVAGLWRYFCNKQMPMKRIWQHVGARAVCLIAVPAVIYVACFWVHFQMLNKFGGQAKTLTLEFQQTFPESAIPPTNGPVYYGSTVSLRQVRRDHGGYVHSHSDLYPVGTKQQQVTIYHHRDTNNAFIIRRPYIMNMTYTPFDLENNLPETEELQELRHGDQLRLEHVNTYRFLHSHNEPAPVSTKKENHNEVSAYGYGPQYVSDVNDNWIVLLIGRNGRPLPPPENGKKGRQIIAIKDRFALFHPMARCMLHSNNKKLPEWGHSQGEVTCSREVLPGHMRWMFETNEHPMHESDESNFQVTQRKAWFVEKFLELNGWMGAVNKGLTGSHYFQSRPQSWPMLARGLGYWNSQQSGRSLGEMEREKASKDPWFRPQEEVLGAEAQAERDARAKELAEEMKTELKDRQIYLLGNVVTWNVAALAVFGLAMLFGVAVIAGQCIRTAPDGEAVRVRRAVNFVFGLTDLEGPGGFLLISWGWHFFPFFLMQRQLFVHHYLPALWCGIVLAAWLADRLTRGNRRVQVTFAAVLVAAALVVFYAYSPLIYGLPLSGSRCEALKLRSRWDWDCYLKRE